MTLECGALPAPLFGVVQRVVIVWISLLGFAGRAHAQPMSLECTYTNDPREYASALELRADADGAVLSIREAEHHWSCDLGELSESGVTSVGSASVDASAFGYVVRTRSYFGWEANGSSGHETAETAWLLARGDRNMMRVVFRARQTRGEVRDGAPENRGPLRSYARGLAVDVAGGAVRVRALDREHRQPAGIYRVGDGRIVRVGRSRPAEPAPR